VSLEIFSLKVMNLRIRKIQYYIPVGKIAKKKKYTLTDCFFGDFAHWDIYTMNCWCV